MSLTSKNLNLQHSQELNITDALINDKHNYADSRVGDIILGAQNNIVENPEHNFLRGDSRNLSNNKFTYSTYTYNDTLLIGLLLVNCAFALAKVYCPNHGGYSDIPEGDSWMIY